MSVLFTDKEKEVMRNTISAVESGGMVYGGGNYGAFAEAYTTSSAEHSITIGRYQNYGTEARKLLLAIQKANPTEFKKLDTAGIAADLNASNWSKYQIKKTSDKAKCIINIITSDTGKRCQDQLFDELLQSYIDYANGLGVADHKALAMCANFNHQGGSGAVKRIVSKTAKPYTIDNLYAASKTDTGNQVGAYKNRQAKVYEFLNKYWPSDGTKSTVTQNIETTNTDNYGGKSMIANSGHDENNKYSGGKAGDQTGKEFEIRSWYNRPWTCVLRHPDANVRELIATLAEEAANNNLIGYNQADRTSFWTQLTLSNYRPKNIKKACNQDCSAGVSAICKAAGYIFGNTKLQAISKDTYSGNMKAVFKNAGFTVLTASKYLTSPDYLLRGDVLLAEGHHACTNITNGSKSGVSNSGANNTTTTVDSGNGSLNSTPRYDLYAKKDGVKLRVWGGSTEKQLTSYPAVSKNTVLKYCDGIKDSKKHDWYYVQINGSNGQKYGFVDSDDVQNTKIETASTNNTTVNGNPAISISNGKSFNTAEQFKGTVIAKSALNFRTWCSTNAAQLKSIPTIPAGAVVSVCDAILSDDNGKDLWYYCKYNGKYGFCFASYIKKK